MDNQLSGKDTQALQRLARINGIQTTYIDVHGVKQNAKPETLVGILESLGVEVKGGDIQRIADEAEEQRFNEVKEPVYVLSGLNDTVDLRLPESAENNRLRISVIKEDGGKLEWTTTGNELRTVSQVSRGKRKFHIKSLKLPDLPHGYHTLAIETKHASPESFLICAPRKSYSDPTLSRSWGVFLPMYAAHSSDSWGAGTFQDWIKLGSWVGNHGGRIVGSLPILAAFLDENFCDPSPYSPVSRLFWNEFFLDVETLSNGDRTASRLIQSAKIQDRITRFRSNNLVDYKAEMRVKRQILETLAKRFFAKGPREEHHELARLRKEHPHLETYARFRATMEKRKAPWQQWPERLRKGNLRSSDFDPSVRDYHLFVQWQATKQLEDVVFTLENSNVKFYLDLPLGVNPSGYDVWREQKLFALNASVGAPPDGFFTKGQDWGFAPLHPERLRKDRYRHLLEVLRFQMANTGLLRIDHVMALRRLYWIPKGRPASEGAYVSYPANELFAIVSLESHRNKTVVVGENLGTVPPEVNTRMLNSHVRQMYVVQYETKRKGPALAPPPKRSVASLNTHDMPPFGAFVSGSDLADRADLGLIDKRDIPEERKNRRQLLENLSQFLRKTKHSSSKTTTPTQLLEASLKYLSASEAEILLINLEDLWLEKQSQNTPGTCTERPNWVRKSKLKVDDLPNSRKITTLLRELNALRNSPEDRPPGVRKKKIQ